MTLETLFAQAGQEQAFLTLLLCGVALGAALQATEAARRALPVLAIAWDTLTALLCALSLLFAMLRYGGGVRLYGLLGLTVGVVLYMAGPRAMFGMLGKWISAALARKKSAKSAGEKEGITQGKANNTSKEVRGA